MRAFLSRAVGILIMFAVLHLLGFRKYTCLISGTASFGYLRGLCGAAYIVFYGLSIVGVPVFLLASGLAKGIEWIIVHADRSTDGDHLKGDSIVAPK